MKSDQVEASIRRWRELHERNPAAAVRRLRLLLLLGEALVPMAALVALAVVGLLVAVAIIDFTTSGTRARPSAFKLPVVSIVVFLFIGWQVGWAWLVSRRMADGIRLDRASAPRLFERLVAISTSLGCRVPDRVLLDDDLNASTVAVPRLLPFRRVRIAIRVGLPLFELLSPSQLDSVLAHELSHQRPGEFALSGRVGALVSFWMALATRISGSRSLFGRFVGWYVPRLTAATHAILRRSEFDADRGSAEAVGLVPTVGAVTRIAPYASLLPRFYAESLRRAAVAGGYGHADLIRDRRAFLQAPPDDRVRREWAALLRTPPDDYRTHPTPAERIRELAGASARPENAAIAAGSPRALEAIFGPDPDQVSPVAELMKLEAEGFEAAIAACRERRPRLATLDALLKEPSPPSADRRGLEAAIDEWLYLSSTLDSPEGTIRRARRATELLDDYGDAWAALAITLLSEDDSEGIPAARRAIELEAVTSGQVIAALATYHERQGNVTHAERAWRASRQADDRSELAAKELEKLPKVAALSAPDLGADAIEGLARAIRSVKTVKCGWLVRWHLEHAPTLPAYLLVLDLRSLSFTLKKPDEIAAKVLEAAGAVAGIPGPIRVMVAGSTGGRLARAARRLGGNPIR